MGSNFEVVFGGLFDGFSESILIERILSDGLDEASVFFLYLFSLNESRDEIFCRYGGRYDSAVELKSAFGFSQYRVSDLRVNFGMISFIDMLNHK